MNAFAIAADDSSSLRWGLRYTLSAQEERPFAVHLDAAGNNPWLASVIGRLRELAALPGVDPRGSRPMSADDLIEALSFMKLVMRPDTVAPWIGLLNTGGLQVNWRRDDVEVEAIFDRARDEHVVYLTVADQEWEAPVREAHSLFSSVVDRLSSSDLEQQTLA